MSRVGMMPVPLPEGVEVTISGNEVTIEGPKGSLTREFHPDIEIVRDDGELNVRRPTNQRRHRELHGLTRSLLNNMVVGVTEGYERKLEIQGVGYRVELTNDGSLDLQLGFSQIGRASCRASPIPCGSALRRASSSMFSRERRSSRSGGPARRRWGRWQRRFEPGAHRNLIRGRASVTSASTFRARRARRARSGPEPTRVGLGFGDSLI